MKLGGLIVSLSALTALVMLASSFYASYDVHRSLLINNTLESNHAYAAKLAGSAEIYFRSAIQQLGFSARLQGRSFDNQGFLKQEAERLLEQTASFNSVAVVDKDGIVRAIAPATLDLLGQKLESDGSRIALHSRTPVVSSPYLSAAHNLVVFISHPVINSEGSFLGYVGGTLYLKQDNILQQLLSNHYYSDGSYLYVVDRNRRLLYHPDSSRIGSVVGSNALVDRMANESDGKQRVINSQGVDMLAGFATAESVGWGVVAQRPVDVTLRPLNRLLLDVILKTMPFAIFSFAFIWWIARRISLPLRQMAQGAQRMNEAATQERITKVSAWYFESFELKRAMLLGLRLIHERIGELRQEVQTDPLTGLSNRRGLDLMLEHCETKSISFSVIALDIDHFKCVNDTYGHDTGDLVLRELAQLIQECSRSADFPCRTGGEEFLILLPKTGVGTAEVVAERLRRVVEEAFMPGVGRITISLGVAYWSGIHGNAAGALKAADEALYDAKESGRNRVQVSVSSGAWVNPVEC